MTSRAREVQPDEIACTRAPGIWQISLPLPPPECQKNYHGHWRARAEAVRDYRMACLLILRQAIRTGALPERLLPPITIDLEFYLYRDPQTCRLNTRTGKRVWPFYMPHDTDNARIGVWPAQDALVEAGLIPGDSARYVTGNGTVRLRSRAADHQFRTEVVFTIREHGAGQ